MKIVKIIGWGILEAIWLAGVFIVSGKIGELLANILIDE